MSMRSISAVDWADLFESMSLVDSALRADADYAQSNFSTRNRCRHAIEELARGSRHSELDIAERAMQVAGAGGSRRERNPGYHLIARGRRAFEAAARLPAVAAGAGSRVSSPAWGSAATLPASRCSRSSCWRGRCRCCWAAASGRSTLAVLAMLGLVLAVDAAMAVANNSITSRFGARPLPEMELRGRHPRRTAHARSRSRSSSRLPKRSPNTSNTSRFITSRAWTATSRSPCSRTGPMPRRTGRRRRGAARSGAVEEISRLNHKYGPGPAGDRFLLLHRRRVWNAAQGVWMGWERKRGKLHELNRLLRGALDTSFIPLDGQPPAVPAAVRYVVTLDADTRLPRDTVRRLVGKMAHPLNAPLFDERQRAGRRRLRDPAATNRIVVAARLRRLALPAPRFRRRRHRSLCVRRVRRVPGPLRRGIVRRQGHLRRRRVRGGAGGPRCPKTRCSATTCSKASSRVPDSHPTSNSSTSIPPATRRRPLARIDGYAATGSCCRGCSVAVPSTSTPPARHPAARSLEDVR